MRPHTTRKYVLFDDKKEVITRSLPRPPRLAGSWGSHLGSGEVRGVVETHGGAEVLDAVLRSGREDALRLPDVLQARVEDLQVKVGPRVRDKLPLELLQREHELRQLPPWQP